MTQNSGSAEVGIAPETPSGGPVRSPRGHHKAGAFSVREFGQRYSLIGIGLLLLIVCMIAIPQFRSFALLSSMINAQSIILLLALTATIVLRTGDFDLSISQVMVASAAIVAVLSANGASAAVAVATAFGFGLAVGLVNAFLVVNVGVDSFITTLGSFTAVAGFTLFISDSRLVAGVPADFVNFSRSSVLGLPLVTWYGWILVMILWFVYQRTPLGRYMLFIGGNTNAARLAGIQVTKIRFGAFVVSSLLAAFVGIVYSGYFGAVDPSVGGQYMLQPFAAAFLGATAIAVGRFNSIGTIVALYVLTIGITGLQLLGAQSWITNLFYGLALMASVTAARLAGRNRVKRAMA